MHKKLYHLSEVKNTDKHSLSGNEIIEYCYWKTRPLKILTVCSQDAAARETSLAESPFTPSVHSFVFVQFSCIYDTQRTGVSCALPTPCRNKGHSTGFGSWAAARVDTRPLAVLLRVLLPGFVRPFSVNKWHLGFSVTNTDWKVVWRGRFRWHLWTLASVLLGFNTKNIYILLSESEMPSCGQFSVVKDSTGCLIFFYCK